MNKKIIPLILICVVVAIGGVYYWKIQNIPPGGSPEIDDRIAIFNVSGGAKSPVFTKTLEVNPYYKVKEGEKQTFSIWAKDNVGIEKVTATIATDNGNEIIELKLFEGTEKEGKWQGSWTTKNISANYSYQTEFIAENIKEESTKLTISWTIE